MMEHATAGGAGTDSSVLDLQPSPPPTFEADTPLSTEESAAVALMKEKLSSVKFLQVPPGDEEYWTSEHVYKRFLVARGWKVDAAVHMFTETIKFRTERACAAMLTTYREPIALRRYFPWGMVGQDKQGFPVLVERVGHVDLVGMNAAVGIDEFLTWVCWYHEVQERIMRRISAKLGRDRQKMTCIIDLSGLSLRHLSSATLNVLKRRTRLEEDNYPEVVKRVFIVNTPAMFASVWGVVKMFMDQGTVDKLQLLGSNFMPTLLNYVDIDVIPKFLGGNLVDQFGDPECKAMISPGGVVPHAIVSGVAADAKGLGEHVTVNAGKHADVLIRVPAGAKVVWNWASADKDINFRVSAGNALPEAPTPMGVLNVTRSVYGVQQLAPDYKTIANPAVAAVVSSAGDLTTPIAGCLGGETDVVPSARLDKHAGSHTFTACSIVRFRWDNSYSWMSSKTLSRRIDVFVNGGDDSELAAGLVESDPMEASSVARQAHYERFGL